MIVTLQNQKDYFIERDLFVKLFKKIDEKLWEYGWSFIDSEFNCFIESDTMFMLNLDSGVMITYYKHLGRCNTCNIDISLSDLKWFVCALEISLKCS